MIQNVFRKSLVLTVILVFLGAGFLPNIYAVDEHKSLNEYLDNTNITPIPHFIEDGVSYNPEQSLYPYKLVIRNAPPSGLIESPPEYDPINGVLFCYKTGHWHEVVVDLVVELTKDNSYDEIAYVVVSTQSEQNTATTLFTSHGANMDKVEFIIEPTNAIWIRDYGPHFIWQADALALVDSNYFFQRSLDDFIPTLVGDDHFIMPTYDIGLHYAGGNFQPGPDRSGFVTSIILNDNPVPYGFDEEYIAELLQTFQGIDDLHIMPALPGSVDGTGHIDMWMYIIDEDTVIISEFKPGSNPTAITITENAVTYMEDLGFEVYRTPAWNANHPDNGYSTHWTYTNSFRVNDRIFIPTYGETYPDYSDEDAQALAAFGAAAPNLEIVQINCYPIIWAAGAIHCIVMQVPRYTENEPVAYVISPNGGEYLESGTSYTIEWVATDEDNAEIPQIDLYYSANGGSSYEFIDSTTNTGFYDWIVPNIETTQAKIKVVAISQDSDESEAISSDVFEIGAADIIVYDFSSGVGTNHRCFGSQTSSWSYIDGQRTPVTTELSSGDYTKLAYSDATGNDYDSNRYRSPIPSGGAESTHIFEFTLEEDPDDIIDLEIHWEGYGDACTQVELYIWDYDEEQWGDAMGRYNQNRYLDCWSGNRDGFLKTNIRIDFDRYINSNGKITLLLYDETLGQKTFHDYVSIKVSIKNSPPEIPTITGSISGSPGISYEYKFNAVDPDGDDVRYIIDWDDTTSYTTLFAPSGDDVTVSHTWTTEGTYTITAKAEDEFGLIGPEGTLTVTMPRNKAINRPFLRFIESHPNIFPILQKLFQRLGF